MNMEYFAQIGTIVCAGGIFFALILSLAIPPKYTKRVLSWIAVICAVAALIMYGFGYSSLSSSFGINTLHTVADVCHVFVGSNNWEKIAKAYGDSQFWEFISWTVHLLAMTTSASAVIVSLGSQLLKRIRIRLLRRRNINLIFGLNENTLEFGHTLSETKRGAVLFVDKNPTSKSSVSVEQMGALLRTDADALNGTVRFLKSLGLKPGKRKLFVYALDGSYRSNLQYATGLLTALEAKGILPEQLSLTLLGPGNDIDHALQATPEHYGFGSLISINKPELIARILTRNYPPYQSLTFNAEGCATSDFHAVVIGFGQTGQAVLRQLIMNSQFKGSNCRISVFAPDYKKQMGWIWHEYREMLDHYNVSLFPFDGRSRQLYDYLSTHIATVNYIVICTGSEIANLEIGERLQTFLQHRNCNAPILMCSNSGVHCQSAGESITSHNIYTPEILCSDEIDRMAMVLNQSYQRTGNMRQNWITCNYFDRMSSRAAADFCDALLYCAGTTREQALTNWNPQGALLENLAATEHLRWNAFHYCMGFRPMTEQEFQERAAIYLEEKAKDPNTGYRITKDISKRIHACMIPWEALDDYSKKENAITGGHRDYAENDRNNVRDLAKVLHAMKQ